MGRSVCGQPPPEKEKKNISKGTPKEKRDSPAAGWASNRGTGRLVQWLNALLRSIDSIIQPEPSNGLVQHPAGPECGLFWAGSRPALVQPSHIALVQPFNAFSAQPLPILGPAQNPV